MADTTQTPQGKALSTFLKRVTDLVKEEISEEWITAEISQLSINKPGAHMYFELVEHDADGKEVAKAKAALWASGKDRLISKFQKETGAELKAGIKVMFLVAASFHPQYGFSVSVKDINPTFTIGDMQKKLLQIRAALTAAGVFGKNKALKTPTEFTRVAVIAPGDAAGLGDFKSNADILQSSGLCSFDYYHARFQGAGAADEIVGALSKVSFKNFELGFDRHYDAVVIIRGGGAVSDLAYLNEYSLAEAVCRYPVPVMVGIGHERDKVILDEVANYSAHTPSKLIGHIWETIVNNAQANMRNWQYVVGYAAKVTAVCTELVTSNMQNVKTRSAALIDKVDAKTNTDMELVKSKAIGNLKNMEQGMDSSLLNIKMSAAHALDTAKREMDNAFSTVVGLGPKKTLERGFAVARSEGKAVTRKEQAEKLTTLDLEFSDGTIKLQNLAPTTL